MTATVANWEEMPLFPLHAVLFPYATTQLHVFEDRYQDLIRRCMEFDQPFGVVLIRRGEEVGSPAEPYMVGTAVRVVHCHRYEDGRMDVQIHGERRFRVRRIDDTAPYLVGMVEPVVELEGDDLVRLETMAERARDAFRALVEGSISRPEFNVHVMFPSDPTALSFVIANLLPMDNLEKQRLLETTDSGERLGDLIPIIERQIVEAKPPHLERLDSAHLREWISPN